MDGPKIYEVAFKQLISGVLSSAVSRCKSVLASTKGVSAMDEHGRCGSETSESGAHDVVSAIDIASTQILPFQRRHRIKCIVIKIGGYVL